MKNKTLYTEQYVDCEYDITFDDILELIGSCDSKEKQEIRNLLGGSNDDNFIVETLYDKMKLELLSEAFKKFSLEDLEKRLK